MRGWLMLENFNLPFTSTMLGLYSGTMADELAPLSPARTVPVMTTPSGGILTDSLAMAETLHEAHPDARLYPIDAQARALARSLVCEMHSGFSALRGECGMNLNNIWLDYSASDAVFADVERITTLWSMARERFGSEGPWLFGAYSLADVFYAPVACRLVTYGLTNNPQLIAYCDTALAHPALRRWRAMGQTQSYDPFPYPQDCASGDWPIPDLMPAQAVSGGPSENDTCPYSGDPVTHFAKIDGRVFGFCNAFCRDKTVNDPAAWPKFIALWNAH